VLCNSPWHAAGTTAGTRASFSWSFSTALTATEIVSSVFLRSWMVITSLTSPRPLLAASPPKAAGTSSRQTRVF